MMMYHLNKEALVNIATQEGKPGNIHLKAIVKQGAIYGPEICCAADKVNVIVQTSFYMTKELEIKNLIYVDHINESDSKSNMIKLAKKS